MKLLKDQLNLLIRRARTPEDERAAEELLRELDNMTSPDPAADRTARKIICDIARSLAGVAVDERMRGGLTRCADRLESLQFLP